MYRYKPNNINRLLRIRVHAYIYVDEYGLTANQYGEYNIYADVLWYI